MSKRFVFYRDIEMTADWPEKIRAAQEITTYEIGGREFARIRFGHERPPVDLGIACHDCAVVPGEYHVPGCDVERCPACRLQAIACPCTGELEQAEGGEIGG